MLRRLSKKLMNCYYHQNIPVPPACITLDEGESLHAATSRRQQSGDEVTVIDGKGCRASGSIDSVSRSAVRVQIHACSQIEKQGPDLILASALPKGERLKTMLSMIAQLGVVAFVPLDCKRSTVKPDTVNVTRWQRIFREACKQSHNPYFPRIEQCAQPIQCVQKLRKGDMAVWVADPSGGGIPPTTGSIPVGICIGPEGGFTEDEKEGMITLGGRLFSLGSNMLRIETAAVASISIVRHCYGRGENQ